MADYKIMYENIFNTVTDVIAILQKAQSDAEEAYISHEEPKINILKKSDESE